jgi:hypothetical protein
LEQRHGRKFVHTLLRGNLQRSHELSLATLASN